ncbi:MAG TPA: hypothetical protein VGM86_23195 [Thermoanaerobaculia bacterium]|jgi:uncharacterized protein (TIGR02646 family)
MIRIRRPDKSPASLKRWGEKQTRLDCDAYDACPSDYQSGAKKFPKKEYYSAKAVKDLLVEIHHGKCCYCEKKFTRSNLHVEHYRPKSGFRQTLDQKQDDLPGYYWLAYRWDNLLLSCHDCNNLCKGTRFPLANPKKRARSHNDEVEQERPLFIDPTRQDPRKHVSFDQDTPRSDTRQGRMTIEGLRLRRPELREERLEKLAYVNARLAILAAAKKHPVDAELQAEASKARQFLEAAKRPEAEFSAMVEDYLAQLGL